MPTILELFQNQPLPSQGGKTAEEAYAIRNSKDIDISVADPLVNNTGILLAKGARRLLGVKGSESLLEEETTGIRIIRNGAAPIIYGTEFDRISLRTTSTLEAMRAATVGELSDLGSVGSKIKNVSDSVKSALGMSVPITPSYVVGQLTTNPEVTRQIQQTQGRMEDLEIIKSSATGLPATKFLGQLGGLTEGGNLRTAARALAGNTLRLGKDKLREKLYGSGERGDAKDLPPGVEGGVFFDNLAATSTTPFTPGSKQWLLPNVNYGSQASLALIPPSSEPENGVFNRLGLSYSNVQNIYPKGESGERYDLSDKQIISLGYDPNDIDTKLHPSLYRLTPRELIKEYNIEGNYQPSTNGLSNSLVFTKPADTENEEDSLIIQESIKNRNGKVELFIDRAKFSSEPDRAPKFAQKINRRDISTDDFIDNKYSFNSFNDTLNEKGVYSGTDPNLDDQDFITLKFKSIPLNKTINFRSTITGLTETFSPSWEPSNFVGNPFSFYTYTSIERSVSFNFTAFSLNAKEHKAMWDRLNFLQGLTYPQGYYPTSAVKAPLIEFTLGSMYSKKVAFIENLSFTTDDNVPWNIADKVDYVTAVSPTGVRTISTTPENMSNHKLPMMVNVTVGLKFLESRSTTEGRKFYSFTPQTN